MIRWLVAGIGDIAIRRVLPAIAEERRSHLYGVVSRDRAKGERYAPRVWTDLETALADPAIDAVYVATPVALHKPQTLAALAAGKHVLCEKPMALHHAEASDMVRAARESGRVLGIAYYRRTYPKVQRARELLAQGAIGQPVLAEINCRSWFQAEDGRRSWLLDPAMAGGGPLYDIGSHRIDLLNYFFGRPAAVTGLLSQVVHRGEVEDAATVLIDYETGPRGIVDVRWHCRVETDEFRITGTAGVLDLSPLNAPRLVWPAGQEQLPPDANLHLPAIRNFADHLLDGAPLLASGESSIWTDWITGKVTGSLVAD